MTLPIGSGSAFHGLYDLRHGELLVSSAGRDGKYDQVIKAPTVADEALDKRVAPDVLGPFREMAELSEAAYPEFDIQSYREGHLTPVYFGSALKDFGVEQILRALADFAPPPQLQPADPQPVDPADDRVTGFVFKVQANMDPNHRDRIAFVRLVSGRFRRGMKLKQVRNGKPIAVSNPIFFFAQERELAEEAFPGDIIGVPNHGTLRVGDTLVEGEEVRFSGIPSFAPEILRRVRLEDPSRSKQLRSALEDLSEEGVVQAFRPMLGSNWIVGVVGQLQLEVMTSRVAVEYKVGIAFEPAPFETARWVHSDDPGELKKFLDDRRSVMAEDRDGAPVLLARNMWELNRTMEEWPKIQFFKTKERA
jgi:peptide chain release factor 3